MRTHRMSLAHAEVYTARLLATVIDAVLDFELIEIEGDAAFLSRQADGLNGDAVAVVTQAAVSMHRAFHVERRHVAANLCPCDGWAQADGLKLKFVARVGEVATQTIRNRSKCIDVIVVHRLLKNAVPVPEYVLLSEELYRACDGALPGPVHEVAARDFEGIGPVRTYFVDVEDCAGSRRLRCRRSRGSRGWAEPPASPAQGSVHARFPLGHVRRAGRSASRFPGHRPDRRRLSGGRPS